MSYTPSVSDIAAWLATMPLRSRPSILDLMTDDLDEAWARVQAALPEGWVLEGLRCASTGLDPDQRSDDWIAVAVGPDGVERQAQAAQPIEALEALAQRLST